MEEWKDIEGYEGYYMVSDKGRVKSLARIVVRKDGRMHTVKEYILKQSSHPQGYMLIALSKDYKRKTFYSPQVGCRSLYS
jgi:hypothetical protein